jgi:hypothetical protein
MINEERPVIGFVSRDNIPLVDSLLHSPDAKAVIPNTLRFAWNQYPLDEWPDLFQLLALKTNSFGKPRVPGTNIRNARQDFEPYTTMPMVSIEMDEDGTAEWRRLTRTSIGRNVPLSLMASSSPFQRYREKSVLVAHRSRGYFPLMRPFKWPHRFVQVHFGHGLYIFQGFND